MNLLSTAEALRRFNLHLGDLAVSRQSFNAKIVPLLASTGDAQKIGREWVIDGGTFWMWEVYAATRRALIDAGEWSRSRPWSAAVADMEAIAHDNAYEDYGPATAWPETKAEKS